MSDAYQANNELRVLLLAGTAKDVTLTCNILDRAGIECIGCSSLADLTNKLNDGAGAVIIPEEAVAGGGDGSLGRYLAAQPSWSDLPILVLAHPGADSVAVATVMDRYGNVTVLERPMRIASLVSAVRSAIRARMRQYQVRDDAEALAKARDELEEQVRARTAELSETNRMLEKKMEETTAAERRAHMLLRELVTAEETERARISRDLHDELGQKVTSLRLHLSQLGREVGGSQKAQQTLSQTTREAEDIDSQISFLAWTIRPTTIEEMGLAQALGGYVREWSRNFDIAADFSSADGVDKRLLPEIEVNVYRIAQESLNNVAKYAEANSVAVLLKTTETELTMIVEDDGKGFDTDASEQPASSGGLGIRGMHERAALLGGSVEIESTNRGTTVYLHIPARFR